MRSGSIMAQDIALLVKCKRTAIEIFRRLIRSNRHQAAEFRTPGGLSAIMPTRLLLPRPFAAIDHQLESERPIAHQSEGHLVPAQSES